MAVIRIIDGGGVYSDANHVSKTYVICPLRGTMGKSVDCFVAFYLSMLFIVGNSSTSRMDWLFVSNITKRSMP